MRGARPPSTTLSPSLVTPLIFPLIGFLLDIGIFGVSRGICAPPPISKGTVYLTLELTVCYTSAVANECVLFCVFSGPRPL
jgi:hypothetical protein